MSTLSQFMGGSSTPQYKNIYVFTSSDSAWPIPPGVTKIEAWCLGAGGSGAILAGSSQSVATGGGAGGLCKSILSVTPGNTLNISVGAGGSKTTSGNGVAGGSSSISGTGISTMTANGGSAGTQLAGAITAVSGGAGQGSSGGNVFNLTGGSGGSVDARSFNQYNAFATGGGGAPSFLGNGADGGSITSADNGIPVSTDYYPRVSGGGGVASPGVGGYTLHYGGTGYRTATTGANMIERSTSTIIISGKTYKIFTVNATYNNPTFLLKNGLYYIPQYPQSTIGDNNGSNLFVNPFLDIFGCAGTPATYSPSSGQTIYYCLGGPGAGSGGYAQSGGSSIPGNYLYAGAFGGSGGVAFGGANTSIVQGALTVIAGRGAGSGGIALSAPGASSASFVSAATVAGDGLVVLCW